MDYQRKLSRFIHAILVIGFLAIVGAYIGFGFLAKWHWAYDVFVSILIFVFISVYFQSWQDMFKGLYNIFVKEQNNG